MAVVNVANLMLARSLARQRELAVRAALGASRAAAGAAGARRRRAAGRRRRRRVAGRPSAGLSTRLVGLAPPSLPRITDVAPDGAVVAAAAVLAVVAGAVDRPACRCGPRPGPTCARCCTTPAAAATGASSHGRRLRAGAGRSGQVALAAVLAVQAGLLTRSLAALLDLDPGFQSDHLLTLQMGVPDRLASAEARQVFYREFFAGLRGLPGVLTAGGTTRMPLASTNDTAPVRVEGQLADAAALHVVGFRRTLHDYFAAMRIPVTRGRLFNDDDPAGGAGRPSSSTRPRPRSSSAGRPDRPAASRSAAIPTVRG